MRIHGIRALMLLLAVSSPAWATPVIDVGTHYMLPNDVRTISIGVSGGDAVQGLDFYVQLDTGGPVITGIDLIGPGTLFSQSNKGSQPIHYPDTGGSYLVWYDTVLTQPGATLNATGTLAHVTISTTGVSANTGYALNLSNVLGAFNTDFGTITPTINNGWIVVTNLRDLTWNASASGAWNATTWDGALPAYPTYPNYTSNAIVNTPYTVSVASAQEANSLALSNGGQVTIGAAGSLAVTTNTTIANGSSLLVDGVLSGQNVTLSGTMNLAAGGSAQAANISGAGTLTVGDGAAPSSLTADSVRVGVLTLGAGSTLTINAIPGGPSSAGSATAPVPEPSALVLLAAAAAIVVCRRRK